VLSTSSDLLRSLDSLQSLVVAFASCMSCLICQAKVLQVITAYSIADLRGPALQLL